MEFNKFLGGNKEELFFETFSIRFQVHKKLINESTRNMILDYMASQNVIPGINVFIEENTYRFEPIEDKDKSWDEKRENYLWFAL